MTSSRSSKVLLAALGLLLASPAATLGSGPRENRPEHARVPAQQNGPGQSAPQDQAERDGDGTERVYDRDHRDYHRWDQAEERAYRSFWEEHHRAYRSYPSLNRREQSHYWKWRHTPQHPASLPRGTRQSLTRGSRSNKFEKVFVQ